jgi:hypothetical protein
MLAATGFPAHPPPAVCRTLPQRLVAFPFPVQTFRTGRGAERGRHVTAYLRDILTAVDVVLAAWLSLPTSLAATVAREERLFHAV